MRVPQFFLLLLTFLSHASAEIVVCSIVGKGDVRIMVNEEWAPIGAERFLHLVDIGYYDGTALFRAVPGFLVQFGISKNKQLRDEYMSKTLKDDPLTGRQVVRGTLAYAGGGKDSRSTQIWIAYSAVPSLGKELWEAPFGQVIDGMEYVESIYTGYGDGPPWGKGVAQGKIWNEGYSYLTREFPKLDYIGRCSRESAEMREEAVAHKDASVEATADVKIEPVAAEAKIPAQPKVPEQPQSGSDATKDTEYNALFAAAAFFLMVCAVIWAMFYLRGNKAEGKSA